MIPRSLNALLQGFSCISGPKTQGVLVSGFAEFAIANNGLFRLPLAGGTGFARAWCGQTLTAANCKDFPFHLTQDRIKLSVIKTQKRGFAVCVKQPFFLRQSQHFPLLAALATKIRQPIAPLCVRSVALLPVRLLPMQQAAAKPKGRLLARSLVAFRAACLACLPATDTSPNSGLTAALNRSVTTLTRSFGGIPRVAFLHFCALCAHPRKGCYV
ncbi:hypothetical protein ACEN2J_11900 [Pseudorhodobacter sp. W20_MBD10_FR17]|uniref:hypothetical protein n=1 Tax=Pseudorhodobacter sp. W20_MBD10_FR17 TaxID=3240266 RepID=UPI003F9AE1D3